MNVYLASSWRNPAQPLIVDMIRNWGFSCYDFRNPPGSTGFAWREVNLAHAPTAFELREALKHPRARQGFASDMGALRACDACVLLLPCGRSAHLELGYAVGAGKRTAILAPVLPEPELMYSMVDLLATSYPELKAWLDT